MDESVFMRCDRVGRTCCGSDCCVKVPLSLLDGRVTVVVAAWLDECWSCSVSHSVFDNAVSRCRVRPKTDIAKREKRKNVVEF